MHEKFFSNQHIYSVLLENKNRVTVELNQIAFKSNIFDLCFSLLSLNNSNNTPLFFKNVYSLLKEKGVFIAVIPSDECFWEFRSFL